jgi:hypothetical protein
MESIIEYVQRKLLNAGPKRFAGIARETGVSVWTLPKLAYGYRDNPRIQTVQPLLDYFQAIDRGERELPPPAIDPRYLPRVEEPMESHP